MSFGQSHRELVQNTNEGLVEPTSKEQTRSTAQVGALQTRHLGQDHEALAALVDVAGTVAQPAIAEANRKKELEAYEAAGTEEGKKAADSASDVWHNRIFGADASLRGAQERIAEDNSRRIYLKAQELLETGGADSWDDEKWKEWKDEQLEEEIGKYNSEGMKDLITSSMGRDFQNLERDREWKHQEYLQAENRKSVLEQATTIAETYNADRSSPNIQRSEEDSQARLQELRDLKEKSGMSDLAFSSAMAQIFADELTQGRNEFAQFIKDEGFLDELSFEDQQRVESALRVHDIKNGEEFGNRSNAIYGPTGYIAQGNETRALEAFDSLIADYPEAIPPGGRNAVRDQVRQAAWGHAESRRHRQERALHAKDDASEGTETPFAVRDQWGNITGYEQLQPHERLMGLQTHLAEKQENEFHARQKANDPTYERRPLTPQERQQNYIDDADYTAKMMEQNKILLPEIANAMHSTINSLNHDLENMDAGQQAKLKSDLHAYQTMMNQNPAVAAMFYQELGNNFGLLEFANTQLKDPNVTTATLATQMKLNQAQGLGAQGQGVPGKQAPTNTTGSLTNNGENTHTLGHRQRRDALSSVQNGSDEGALFGIFGRAKRDTNRAILDAVETEYSNLLSQYTNPNQSQQDIAFTNAIAKVSSEGAYLSTGNGKEFFFNLGEADNQVREAGYTKGGLNEFLKEVGNNQHHLDEIEKQSGIKLTSWFGNPLTSNGAVPVDLGNGQIGIQIPRDDPKDDRGAYTYVLDLPHVDNPQDVPKNVRVDRARTAHADSIVHDSEAWKAVTGDRRSPMEQLDHEINMKIINENVDAFVQKHGVPINSKGVYDAELLAPYVTQEERDNYMPAHEYNKSLIDRRADAVTKAVADQRRRDNLINEPINAARGWNKRRLSKRRHNQGRVTEYEGAPDVAFIREGESREEGQARQNAAMAEFEKGRSQFRQEQADRVRLKEPDDLETRLKGLGKLK